MATFLTSVSSYVCRPTLKFPNTLQLNYIPCMVNIVCTGLNHVLHPSKCFKFLRTCISLIICDRNKQVLENVLWNVLYLKNEVDVAILKAWRRMSATFVKSWIPWNMTQNQTAVGFICYGQVIRVCRYIHKGEDIVQQDTMFSNYNLNRQVRLAFQYDKPAGFLQYPLFIVSLTCLIYVALYVAVSLGSHFRWQ